MNTLSVLMQHPMLSLMIITMIGLFMGSFLNVVIYRLPLMLEAMWCKECYAYLELPLPPELSRSKPFNLCWPLSHCPHCQILIKPWHNIPLFSYFYLRGRCSACHASISMRYPLIELITGIASLCVSWHFGWTAQCALALLFTWISIVLAAIDLEHYLLPDQLTLPLLWLGLFSSVFHVFTDSHDAILGALVGYLFFASIQKIFYWMTGKIGIGEGDFKYLAALGGLFGWQVLPNIVLLASVSGVVCTLIIMLCKRNFESVPLPFGPYLVLAGWAMMLSI